MKRKFAAVLAAFLLAIAVCPPAYADSVSFIFDDGDKLRYKTELSLLAQEVYDATNVAVCYASCESLGGMTVGEYVQSLYDEKIGCAYGVLLLDSAELESYAIYASRAAREQLTDNELGALLGVYAEPESYDKSVEAYFNAAYELFDSKDFSTAALPTDSDSVCKLPRVADEAGVLDADTLSALNAAADELSEKYACDVAVVFVSSADAQNIQDYSDDFYSNNVYGYGDNYSGVLLTVDVSTHLFAVTTGGKGVRLFTDYGLAHMEKQYESAVKRGDWSGAARRYLKSTEELLNFAETNGRAYSADSAPRCAPRAVLLILLVATLALAYVFRARIMDFIKHVKKILSTKMSQNAQR